MAFHPTSLSTHGQLLPLPQIPNGPRQEHAVVYMAPDTIAVLGGVIPNASAPVVPFSTTTEVLFYSIRKATWRSVAPLPVPLHHPNVAVVGENIYVFGGLDDGGKARDVFRATGESWVYETSTNSWSSIPSLPHARAYSAIGVDQKVIYLAGGFTELIAASQQPLPATLDLVSVFDTKTLKWVTNSVPVKARTLPEGRDHARAEIIDGKMYVIGGFNFGGFNQTDTVFILDLNNLDAGWKTSPAKMPTPRASFAIGVLGKEIFTVGGEGNETAAAVFPIRVFDSVEVYNVEADAWKQLSPISYPRQGPGVAVNGKLYMPGGADREPVGPISRFDAYVL
ncbi:galactose oxidase [Tothia fuscella]|uniref:Galactose oxidase n=1 Tax=Tothia fuscella TaxID=1048955 RepID=A0A9P4TRT2_9PEZI|nr:galactose oxidase [Tothia fuscella]